MNNQQDMAKEAFAAFITIASAQAAMRNIPLPDMEEANREYIRSVMEDQAKKLDPVKKYLLRLTTSAVVNVRDV